VSVTNIGPALRLREARALLGRSYSYLMRKPCAEFPHGLACNDPPMTIEAADALAVLDRAAAAGVDPVEAARAFIGRELQAFTMLHAMDPERLVAGVARGREVARRETATKARHVDLLDVVTELRAKIEAGLVKAGLAFN
jgi:hypothetical protein